MAEEQAASGDQSLIARVFGGRIAQATGILGVAYTLFSGLEPFLKFSRFMAYLVNHWRSLTRGLWMWLASFVALEPPAWALDLATLLLFIFLFTLRGLRDAGAGQRYLNRSVVAHTVGFIGANLYRKLSFTKIIWQYVLVAVFIVIGILVVPFAIFLTMHIHLGSAWAGGISISIAMIYCFTIIGFDDPPWYRVYSLFLNSERAMLVLIGLVMINFVALHSNNIEAFIKKATQ